MTTMSSPLEELVAGTCGIIDWIWLSLEWKENVDERCESLNGHTVLGIVQEISLTALIFRVPVEDIELVVIRLLRCISRTVTFWKEGSTELAAGVIAHGLA